MNRKCSPGEAAANFHGAEASDAFLVELHPRRCQGRARCVAIGVAVSSLVLSVYLGRDFAKRLPMANQFINAIRNARSLTEHQATGGTYILLKQLERASNIDSHFLQDVVGQANGVIAFPVFDHHMMFHRGSRSRLDEVSARAGGRLLPTKSCGAGVGSSAIPLRI